MVTKVTIEFEAVTLATVRQALAALQLAAQAASATIEAQTAAQLTAEASADTIVGTASHESHDEGG